MLHDMQPAASRQLRKESESILDPLDNVPTNLQHVINGPLRYQHHPATERHANAAPAPLQISTSPSN